MSKLIQQGFRLEIGPKGCNIKNNVGTVVALAVQTSNVYPLYLHMIPASGEGAMMALATIEQDQSPTDADFCVSCRVV